MVVLTDLYHNHVQAPA